MASRTHFPSTCVAQVLILMLPLVLISNTNAMPDSAEEKRKCIGQLTGITSCLPYVGGDAKTPTTDCCTGLKQAMEYNKKCVCIVIKDRNDPDLGLKLNATLALGLPSLCKTPDNFSQCPSLLHLDPTSADAQVFNQLGPNSNNGGSPSPAAEGSSGNAQRQGNEYAKGEAISTPEKNDACYLGKRMLALEGVVAGLLILF